MIPQHVLDNLIRVKWFGGEDKDDFPAVDGVNPAPEEWATLSYAGQIDAKGNKRVSRVKKVWAQAGVAPPPAPAQMIRDDSSDEDDPMDEDEIDYLNYRDVDQMDQDFSESDHGV